MTSLSGYIDHTLLHPTTTIAEVIQCCEEAKIYGFAAVCIPPPYVALAKTLLKETGVKVATVIGFPFGYSTTEAKLAEMIKAIEAGVDELDVVHNRAALKNGDWKFLEQELRLLVESAHHYRKVLKVIIETAELTDAELKKCCEVYSGIQVDYIKTSTGYASGGATVEAVKKIRQYIPPYMKIKASGGIRNRETALAMIEAGASRLGCSSSIAIVGAEA